MVMWYDKDADVLNLQLKQGYWKSVELPNSIIIDIDKDGSISAIEILQASKVFSGDVRRVIELAKATA